MIPFLSRAPFVCGAAALSLSLAAACNPLKPRAVQEKQTSQVAVAFDPAALGSLADKMKTLQVRIYKVENDVAGAQEGADQRLAIELQKADYLIKGVKLGLKDFEVSILDDANLALGVGRVRHLVQPGANKTDKLVIKLTAVAQPLTEISVELTVESQIEMPIDQLVKKAVLRWKSESSGVGGDLVLTRGAGSAAGTVTYQEIMPLLEESCTSCHQEGFAKKKLKLDRFPFESEFITDNAALMTVFMQRIQDAENPMPPSELMETSIINKMKQWQAAGFPEMSQTEAANLFRAAIKDLKIADKITGTLIIYGDADVELLKQEVEPFAITANGVMKIKAVVNPEEPSVTIPIVVEPANP